METRQGFLDQGIGYDVAMVSLNLAVLYIEGGRTAEVLRIAEEMVALFEAQDVHREALAALRLFLEAAQREEATAELVLEIGARWRQRGARIRRPWGAPFGGTPMSRLASFMGGE